MLVAQLIIKGSRLSGERSTDVFVTCITRLFMQWKSELSGLLNGEDPTQLFTLHTMFFPRIKNSPNEFSEAFNNTHHAVCAVSNWAPYHMWMNGMMHANNPISHGDVNGEPDYIELYGCDPEGPSPSEQDNNIVVKPVTLDNRQSAESILCWMLLTLKCIP